MMESPLEVIEIPFSILSINTLAAVLLICQENLWVSLTWVKPNLNKNPFMETFLHQRPIWVKVKCQKYRHAWKILKRKIFRFQELHKILEKVEFPQVFYRKNLTSLRKYGLLQKWKKISKKFSTYTIHQMSKQYNRDKTTIQKYQSTRTEMKISMDLKQKKTFNQRNQLRGQKWVRIGVKSILNHKFN